MDTKQLNETINSMSERDLAIVHKVVGALTAMKENKYPFLGNFLGIQEEPSDDPEVFICSMPIDRSIQNPYRIVYGGITATLHDMAMPWMLELRKGGPQDKFITLEMNVKYHKPGTGKKLIATTRVVHQAQEIWQLECVITNDKGDLVSTATGTFYQLVKGRG